MKNSGEKQANLRRFRTIPGVGNKIAEMLCELGLHSVEELKGRNPEELYSRLCAIKGTHMDRCLLYVFRCAVYYASNTAHDQHLLKWWNWKDKR